MTIGSPGRAVTFFAVLFIAILLMTVPEWNFMVNAKSAVGNVKTAPGSGDNIIIFKVQDQHYEFIAKFKYGLPELERGEQLTVRYLIDEDGRLLVAHVYWFWSLFHGKILFLLVMCLPWYAFVWAMPATWRLRIGPKPEKPSLHHRLPKGGMENGGLIE